MKEVKVNERGRRIGESHPRATLTDHEIDLLREGFDELLAELPPPRDDRQHDAGRQVAAQALAVKHGVSGTGSSRGKDRSATPAVIVARIMAKKFDLHERSVRKIVNCDRRGQTPARAKRIP